MFKKVKYFISDFYKRFKVSAHKRGIYHSAILLLYEFYYDRKLKLNTPNLQSNLENTIEESVLKDSHRNTNGFFYLFFKGINKARINPAESNFIDIGCGSGKILAAAISIGFHKVSGIDLDKEGLQNATVACNEISKRFNNSDFEIDNIDAATYDIPNSINVIFMFNPFGKKTMIEVIKNIRKSFELSPRRICIIYQNPVFEKLFYDSGFISICRIVWSGNLELNVFELS
ncbi:hypothetical protein LBMAG27_20490 [Bacteroidota bacterium]|nr:hypothetical protein LBMAG27_20490 [Bacteroidota bacterium]